jgi:hypothetical protein
MKSKFTLFIAIFCISILVQQISAQGILRNYDTTFRAYPQRGGPNWGWTPSVSFKLNGPIPDSATVSVEYMLPDGKPWVTAECKIESPDYKIIPIEDCGEKIDTAKSTYLTGFFGYKIKLSNELEGTNQVLQTGKIKIGKFVYNPANQPQFNKNFYYYLDNDWRLPIGFVYAVSDSLGEFTQLSVDMWFKGKEAEYGDYAGYLYYRGNKLDAPNAGSITPIAETANETNPYEYYKRAIRISANITCQYSDNHRHPGPNLKDNPGEYELKVTHKGKLVRSVKFNIGDDGFPVDNGIAKNSNLGTDMVIVPVSVLGTLDGTWNKTAWQTEAFWGNTLKGFTAIP